jgi:hypothetical protein
MKLTHFFKTGYLTMTVKIFIMSCYSFIPTTGSSLESYSKTPLMGWASWNSFGVKITESIIREQADNMITSGLAKAGYNYINIDDGYFNGRYANGMLQVDSVKFPHGMKALADYIHSKGLKAGIYSEAGSNTCGSVYNGQAGGVGAGMYNHDQQDIDLFFKTWGYDFLKVDFCSGKEQLLDEKTRYTTIKAAINNTGRTDISYNICRWQFPGSWVTSIANSWRISEDISASWNSVLNVIDKNTYLAPFVSAGHFNDMDMLEVGRGMTHEEDKSHFSMWCMLSSPLVLGNNLRTISPQTLEIVTNAEVISVDQDTTGLQGHLVSDNRTGKQVWAKHLHGKQSREYAVVLFNRSAVTAQMSIKWKELNLTGAALVRDLWSHTDLGSMDSMYTVSVPSHGVVMLKVTGNQGNLQEVFEAEYAWINNFNLTQNGATMAGQGTVALDSTCSGGAKVCFLGNRPDNYIEFRDIFTNKSGRYNLTLSYLCTENRSAVISINGKDTVLTNLKSGILSPLATSTFPINLSNGYNTVRISNKTDLLPDIDRIRLNLNPVIKPRVPFKFIQQIQKLLKTK